MSVFLSVLKIIGLVILCILLFVIALILLTLFVPIRYKGNFDRDDADSDFVINGRVSFLLHIISARVSYDTELSYYLKVFGIKIKDSKRAAKETKDENTGDTDTEPYDESEEYAEADNADEGYPTFEDYTIDWNGDDVFADESSAFSTEAAGLEESEDADETEENIEADNTQADNSQAKSDASSKKPKKSHTDWAEKLDSIISKLIDKKEAFEKKYSEFKKKYKFWKKMLSDERNKSAASTVYKCCLKLLSKYKPYKSKGIIHFGFDDPATTGSVLMYLGILYPALPKGIEIDPDFEQNFFYGHVLFKGKIRLCHLAAVGLKLLLNKDIRRLRKLYEKRP